MTDRPDPDAVSAGVPDPARANDDLFFSAYSSSIPGIARALADGADVNYTHPQTGLCALHVAIGTNDFAMVRYLIEKCGATFFPDRFGRWPTLIAAECEVDDALSDYIVEAEARFVGQDSTEQESRGGLRHAERKSTDLSDFDWQGN